MDWAPQIRDKDDGWIVLQLNDEQDYVLASRKIFPTKKGAENYKAPILPSLKPIVVRYDKQRWESMYTDPTDWNHTPVGSFIENYIQ